MIIFKLFSKRKFKIFLAERLIKKTLKRAGYDKYDRKRIIGELKWTHKLFPVANLIKERDLDNDALRHIFQSILEEKIIVVPNTKEEITRYIKQNELVFINIDELSNEELEKIFNAKTSTLINRVYITKENIIFLLNATISVGGLKLAI